MANTDFVLVLWVVIGLLGMVMGWQMIKIEKLKRELRERPKVIVNHVKRK